MKMKGLFFYYLFNRSGDGDKWMGRKEKLTDWICQLSTWPVEPILEPGSVFFLSSFWLRSSLEGFDSWHIWVSHMPWEFLVGRENKAFQGTIDMNACAAHQGDMKKCCILMSCHSLACLFFDGMTWWWISRHCAMWPRCSGPQTQRRIFEIF